MTVITSVKIMLDDIIGKNNKTKNFLMSVNDSREVITSYTTIIWE
ncbi:hypothetical protein [Wolbachia endosymbiont of Cruorifilaria tuberocauda]|nr:hypothetical protein [Wolbachia endosymbiont of Cruorifilaria tuberocauda]